MSTKKNSDVVLVYDRYYKNKPEAATLIFQRVILCCGITVCAMMFLLAVYRFPVSLWLAGWLCIIFSAFFSVLFIFVKKRFAIPGSLALTAALILLNHERFYSSFSYFTDAVWLLIDGRFISSKVFTEHSASLLMPDNPDYVAGVTLGFTLMIVLFSMITAASMFTKPRIVPSFVTWLALWTPVLISERFTFYWWLVPTLSLYAGAFAMSVTHRDGLALRSGVGSSYRVAAAKSERDYLKTIGRTPFGKRTEMSAVYYSKYFSVAIYATALVTLLGVVSGILLANTHGFDYTKMYNWFKSVGQRVGEKFSENSPFESSGPVRDYFASSSGSAASHTAGLTITSPGRSNQEILKVTNKGNAAVYLRGDIGIDFKGTTWTSPVTDEPREWRRKGLADYYRPVEVLMLQSIQQNDFAYMDDIVTSADITVDYLVKSNVAFLPAYTSDFGYYDNEMFDIYGDFVARVEASNDDNMGSVRCTALVPNYTSTDENISNITDASVIADSWDLAAAADNFFGSEGAYAAYEQYVYNTYLGVPANMKRMLDEYMETNNLRNTAEKILDRDFDTLRLLGMSNVFHNDIELQYHVAQMISRHLYTNYAYSLDAVDNSDPNPINTFLNDTKAGHCALYATSMTLMLRELGIPARYCTGFVAQPNGGLETVLRSKNLHAWCEVYFSGIGWVTFDPTSSSQNPAAANRYENSSSAPSNSTSDSDISDSESSRSDSSFSRPEQSGSGSDNSAGQSGYQPSEVKPRVNILPYVLAVLVIVLIVSLTVAVIQRYRRFLEKVQIALKRYYKVDDADAILGKIITVLRVCGLSPGRGELPDKFYARAETTLGCGVLDYKELLEAAAFSGELSDELDCAKLAGLLNQLYNTAEKKLKLFGRIRLRLAILSKK